MVFGFSIVSCGEVTGPFLCFFCFFVFVFFVVFLLFVLVCFLRVFVVFFFRFCCVLTRWAFIMEHLEADLRFSCSSLMNIESFRVSSWSPLASRIGVHCV